MKVAAYAKSRVFDHDRKLDDHDARKCLPYLKFQWHFTISRILNYLCVMCMVTMVNMDVWKMVRYGQILHTVIHLLVIGDNLPDFLTFG